VRDLELKNSHGKTKNGFCSEDIVSIPHRHHSRFFSTLPTQREIYVYKAEILLFMKANVA